MDGWMVVQRAGIVLYGGGGRGEDSEEGGHLR